MFTTASVLSEFTGLSYLVSNIIIFFVILLEMLIIVEPEKIKPVAFLLSLIIGSIALTLVFSNIVLFFQPDRKLESLPLEYNYVEWEEAGLLIGVALFSFESINNIISSRFS